MKISQGDVCDFPNDYYVNIGKDKLVVHTPCPVWDLNDPGHFFNEVSEREVTSLLKDIDVSKDSCIEGISTNILKHGFIALSKQMRYLFNTSMQTGVFPCEWVKSLINILPKGCNLKDPSNWRPISQTLLPAKLLEKLVQKRFLAILNEQNYISDYQRGFMSGRSTQLASFDILRDIYEARNSKKVTGMVFLDVRKAFDSLDHNIILFNKLKSININGRMLQWFYSYLDRIQRVRHNGMSSLERKFQCGIPQGSCLGPTLFIFYINEVFGSINNNVKMMMLADDYVLYKSHENCDTVFYASERVKRLCRLGYQ